MLGLFLATVAVALAEQATQDTDCDRDAGACRLVKPFTLRVGAARTAPIEPGRLPWIDSRDRVLVFPGESVTVNLVGDHHLEVVTAQDAETVVSDERLARVIHNSESIDDHVNEAVGLIPTEPMPDAPKVGVRLTLRQAADSERMMLFVENATDGPLAYDAGMLVSGSSGMAWEATSVCVVRRANFAVENWNQPIMSLSLGGFERGLEPPANGSLCR